LAQRHPEVAGLVAVNPFLEPVAESFREMVGQILATGMRTAPAIGSDIALPGVTELAYDETPLEPALSLFDAVDDVLTRLHDVRCPVLIMTSVQDHVAPPAGSDRLAAGVKGLVERVTLERSYHVATLDYDKDEIETRAVAFARRVTSA
jgi:carboxylesterase